MATAEELFASTAFADRVAHVAGSDRDVVGLYVAERLADIGDAPERSLVVVTRAGHADAPEHELDIAIRHAASADAAGLAFVDVDLDFAPPATTATIAERAGLALLVLPGPAPVADVVVALHRALTGGADAELDLVVRVLDAVEDAQESDVPPASLAERIAEAAGAPVEGADVEPRTARIISAVVTTAVTRADEAARDALDIPFQSNAELLAQLIAASPDRDDALQHRARSAGIPIDGWHIAVVLQIVALEELVGLDELARFELLRDTARHATDAANAIGGHWLRCGQDPLLQLVRVHESDPGANGTRTAADVMQRVIGRLRTRSSNLRFYCGVGTAHSAIAGLRLSLAEARSALGAAVVAQRVNEPMLFDAIGLRRVVTEWYSSDIAREAAQSLLGPLSSLDPRKREVAVRTLQVYLDCQGSLAKAGKLLHLHRNAVAYRIKRILEIIDVDLDDPDQRLLLQLACRGHLLGAAPS